MKLIFIVIAVISLGAVTLYGYRDNDFVKENDTAIVTSEDKDVNAEKSAQMEEYKNISAVEAKRRLETEKDIILLDVRTKEEYAEGHIPRSMLIPVDRLKAEAYGKLLDKDTPIFVYCRSGRRSVTASEILVGLGYKNVYNLGGIIDWPYETEK
ncbi:MAG: rhodanese-like domain-containing protein [Clostridia bacterium]|nr:rhodanese-like domain-containing protein [Clostridia bacterium]